jgi:hypothetical protein
MKIRFRQGWLHTGALLTSVGLAFGFWLLACRVTEPNSPAGRLQDCKQLMSQVRGRALGAYSGHLRAQLLKFGDLSSVLIDRAITSWERSGRAVAEERAVIVSGGKRFLRRDVEATVRGLQFACTCNLPSEPFLRTAVAIADRDLAIAAYDAAELDAKSTHQKLAHVADSSSGGEGQKRENVQAKDKKQ